MLCIKCNFILILAHSKRTSTSGGLSTCTVKLQFCLLPGISNNRRHIVIIMSCCSHGSP